MTPHLQMLMQEFGFDANDLAYNWRGQITKRQIKKLRKDSQTIALAVFGLLYFVITGLLVIVTGDLRAFMGCIPLALVFAIPYAIIMAAFKPRNVQRTYGQPAIGQTGNMVHLKIGTFMAYDASTLAAARRALDPRQVYVVFHTDKGQFLCLAPHDSAADPQRDQLVDQWYASMSAPMPGQSVASYSPQILPQQPYQSAPSGGWYPAADQGAIGVQQAHRPPKRRQDEMGWLVVVIIILGVGGCALVSCFVLLLLLASSS